MQDLIQVIGKAFPDIVFHYINKPQACLVHFKSGTLSSNYIPH